MVSGLETLKALLLHLQSECKIRPMGTNGSSTSRHYTQLFSCTHRIYPRFCEILQQIGASGLVLIPSEADFLADIKDRPQNLLTSYKCKRK